MPNPFLLLFALLAVSCGGDGLSVVHPDDLSVAAAPDLSGLFLHVRWSVAFNDQPSTCAAAGVTEVSLEDASDRFNVLGSWPCELLEGTTAQLSPRQSRDSLVAPSFNASGVRRSYLGFPGVPGQATFPTDASGVIKLPNVRLIISDEPIPELRKLFTAVAEYYRVQGELPPESKVIAPSPVGACCARVNYVCPPDASYWFASPWKELGFSINHGFYFSYSFSVTSLSPPAFTVSAGADLDCNGASTSVYSITGTWNGTSFVGIDQVNIQNPGE